MYIASAYEELSHRYMKIRASPETGRDLARKMASSTGRVFPTYQFDQSRDTSGHELADLVPLSKHTLSTIIKATFSPEIPPPRVDVRHHQPIQPGIFRAQERMEYVYTFSRVR